MSIRFSPLKYFDYIKSTQVDKKKTFPHQKLVLLKNKSEFPNIKEYTIKQVEDNNNNYKTNDKTLNRKGSSLFERTFSELEKSFTMSRTTATSFYKQRSMVNSLNNSIIKNLISKEKNKIINENSYNPNAPPLILSHKSMKAIKYKLEKKLKNEIEKLYNEQIKKKNNIVLKQLRVRWKKDFFKLVKSTNETIVLINKETDIVLDKFKNSFNDECKLLKISYSNGNFQKS